MNARDWKEDYRRFFTKQNDGSLWYSGFSIQKSKGLWELRDALTEHERVEARKPNLEKAFNFINRRRHNERKAAEAKRVADKKAAAEKRAARKALRAA